MFYWNALKTKGETAITDGLVQSTDRHFGKEVLLQVFPFTPLLKNNAGCFVSPLVVKLSLIEGCKRNQNITKRKRSIREIDCKKFSGNAFLKPVCLCSHSIKMPPSPGLILFSFESLPMRRLFQFT